MVHSGSCKVNPDILDTESLGELNDTIDQTQFLDQTDYLIGKLSDQTEVQIKFRLKRPN